ncbi:hypothetical protein M1567_02930 [Candidatus Marsarchaeota archaeon]|nr:hypothetical protein [Candidatus Marsarchaeota archaeon]
MPDKKKIAFGLLAAYALVLLIVGSLIIFRINAIGGYYWDFAAHMLYAKALAGPAFYSSIANHTAAMAISYENIFYVEWFRAPLMSVLMVPFLPIGAYGPMYYVVAEIAFLIIASVYAADSISANRFLMLAMLITPYAVIYLTLLNGAEILSMALLLFGIGLAARGKWQAGAVLSLAGLAKYFSSIFILLLFFLPGKERLKGFLSYLAVLAAWFAVNFAAYGNPIESYLQSFGEAFVIYKVSESSIVGAAIQSFSIIFAYIIPFIVAATAILAIMLLHRNGAAVKKHASFPNDFGYGERIVMVSFLLALAGTAAVSIHASINNLPRWGYEIYACTALLLGLFFSRAIKRYGQYKRYAYAAIALAALIYVSLLTASYFGIQSHYPFASLGTKNTTVLNAVREIKNLGIENCSIISNAWVYLRYYGIPAHYPGNMNSTSDRYPAVVVDNVGIDANSVNIKGYSAAYLSKDYGIYLPSNHSCVAFSQ